MHQSEQRKGGNSSRHAEQHSTYTPGQTLVLLRAPMKLINQETGETVQFKNLDAALKFRIGEQTLEEHIKNWTHIKFTVGEDGKWMIKSKEN